MGFKVSKIDAKEFENLNEIKVYVKEEEEKIKYDLVSDYFDNNSIFMDDEFLGRGKRWINFNENGFDEFCNTFNLPSLFIKRIYEDKLATKVLNDHIKNKAIIEKAKGYRFVIDKNDNTCIGLVSNTYLTYSNKRLISDLEDLFPNMFNNYEIQEGFVYNTKLYLRMVSSDINAGRIYGYGGNDVDKCKIGLQISNSMIGNSSVRVELFIYRLLCANGLLVQATKNSGRVNHSGNTETFPARLRKQFIPIENEMKTLPKLIKTLLDIEYIPNSLVDVKAQELIYNIIQLPKDISDKRKKMNPENKYQFDLDTISDYPKKYGLELSKKVFNCTWRDNQSIFDFVNVFTEYAHSPNFNIEKRIEIERQTGEFVSYILHNQKKIKEANKKYINYYSY